MFDHDINAFLINAIRMINDVDPCSGGSEDSFLAGDMPSNLFASAVRSLDGGGKLCLCHAESLA